MLIPHHPELLDALRAPTPDDPLRALVSGCLAGWRCGVDETDNGLGDALAEIVRLPTIRVEPFCPELHAMGAPRSTPDIEGGDGFDVLSGRARVIDERGVDLTDAMLAGAAAMLAFAREREVELALLTDMSAACGSQVIALGSRHVGSRRYQRGVGVATAMLLDAGIAVLSQRDHRSLARLRARLDPNASPPAGLLDHHEHPWTLSNLPAAHPRRDSGAASLGPLRAGDSR